MTIDAKKIGLIKVAQHQLGLSDEDYRAVLQRLGRVDSSKDLDATGFRRVMDHFNALGFRSTSHQRNLGDRAGMATPAQVAFIRRLWGEFTDGKGTDLSLGVWLQRTFKVDALRFVDAETAPRVITALRAMAAKKGSAKPAPCSPSAVNG